MPINIIESGSMSAAKKGWTNSRDNIGPVTDAEIAALDASVNELPSAVFHFSDMMILERELVVTPRNHVIWARTSRVDDPMRFTAPPQFTDEALHAQARRIMRHLHDDGVHQDLWRLSLPLCALTSWTTRLTLRDGIRLAKYFYDVGTYVQESNPPLAMRLNDTSAELLSMVAIAFDLSLEVVMKAFGSYKGIKLGKPAFGVGKVRKVVGEYVMLQANMPIATRAQLARHREILIADDLLTVLNAQMSEQLPISTMVTVQATALASTWSTVLGKRTCWMAQADLWQPLTDLFGNTTDGLPCADGRCPYAEDAKQRMAGNDPGAPCPRYSNLTSTPMSDAQWEAAMVEAKARPNADMWRAELGVTKPQAPIAVPLILTCTHAQGCPFPQICQGEGHCDATFNGYR